MCQFPGQDVEDAKQLEVKLRLAQHAGAETLALLETVQSKAPDGFGYPAQEIIGQPVAVLAPAHDQPTARVWWVCQ